LGAALPPGPRCSSPRWLYIFAAPGGRAPSGHGGSARRSPLAERADAQILGGDSAGEAANRDLNGKRAPGSTASPKRSQTTTASKPARCSRREAQDELMRRKDASSCSAQQNKRASGTRAFTTSTPSSSGATTNRPSCVWRSRRHGQGLRVPSDTPRARRRPLDDHRPRLVLQRVVLTTAPSIPSRPAQRSCIDPKARRGLLDLDLGVQTQASCRAVPQPPAVDDAADKEADPQHPSNHQSGAQVHAVQSLE
jgi:hypothetical protein